MPRRPRHHIDEAELLRLYQEERLSQYEIAQQLGLPRGTVRNRLMKLLQPTQEEPVAARSTNGKPAVDTAASPAGDTRGARPRGFLVTQQGQQALRELIVWWQKRTASIQRASDASRQTERITFHVEHRWIEAIRRKADLDEMTLTQVVNEAFRHYFER